MDIPTAMGGHFWNPIGKTPTQMTSEFKERTLGNGEYPLGTFALLIDSTIWAVKEHGLKSTSFCIGQ